MFTRCPHCQTVYRLHAAELHAAGGEVRCSACETQFSALAHLHDTPESAFAGMAPAADDQTGAAASVAGEPVTDTESEPAAGVSVGEHEPTGGEEARQAPEAPLSDSTVGRWAAASASGAAEPETDSSVRNEETSPPPAAETNGIPLALLEDFRAERPDRQRYWLQGAALALLLLLFGQWVYAERDSLYRIPGWQPWLEGYCAVLLCELPWKRASGQFEIRHKDVRAHPQVEGALLVNATVANQAAFIQAHPVVGLFFSDLTGRQRAGRWFAPGVYLQDPARAGEGLAPGESVQVRLEIIDPGEKLISYQFDFR